ncbi:hypothetical protein SAMN05421810_108162 [Amycolatopsis arida]|uniref:Uncharacterized protein n=1 Tax=Amycolatopsis arida TaxID=587909 RepID=A0A1I5Z2K8_9PSEU|nr:hypothetical protein [Amycolatopsis arida]TDX90074.1 hypothetical protein CLV69_108162 [Amycolatopsis arida]SFQ50713.1 hypothetical protein SAMN05421810_108162 [Amycolatopsis arida]
MSGFDVDEHALRAYAQLLKRYAGHATDLKKYITNGGPEVGVAFVPRGTFDVYVVYRELAKVHLMHLMRANERLGTMVQVAEDSAENLDRAATYYETTDEEVAAEFDRHLAGDHERDYPTGGGGEIRKDKPLEVYRKFEDNRDPADVVRKYERTAPSVEEYYDLRQDQLVGDARWLMDHLGLTVWVRELLEEICGVDPLAVIVRYLGGDWHAWYEATCVWEATGAATRTMGSNVGLRRRMEWYWHGVAADTAQGYFARVEEATHAEGDEYYDNYLVPFYRDVTRALVETYDTVNSLVNALLDTVVGIGVAKLANLVASGKAAEVVKLIRDTWDMITDRMSAFQELTKERTTAHLGDEPPCDMESLKRYVHPVHAK